MIRAEDLQLEIGRCEGGSFLRLVHTPTGIDRQKGPLGNSNQHELKRRWVGEIEAELVAKGLTRYLVPESEHKLLHQPKRSFPPFRYEESLSNNPEWALSEGSKFFMDRGAVQEALQRVAKKLDDHGIPYAVAGAMALFRHGYRRFTEDVDVLVTRDGLKQIHEQLEGRGYLPVFAGSKALRDTERGVKVEFIITGEYPGDGKPKPVAFPDPTQVAVELEGIRYVNLTTLIELKLASGMTAPHRLKDLADVQEVIKARRIPREFAETLNPYVRDKFLELWVSPEAE
jgi:hypothetical protein